jgi:hypothetical protein
LSPAELRTVTLGDLADLLRSDARQAEPDRYVDLKTSGCYRHALDAANKGDLPAFRLPGSRKLWVRADDFHAWIERDQHRVVQPTSEVVETTDEVDSIVAFNNARRRKTKAA